MRHLFKWLVSCCLLLAVSVPSYALRCSNRLISEGDSVGKVIKRCGQPTEQDSFQVELILKQGDVLAETRFLDVTYFVYAQSSNQFVRVLRFEDDDLVSIESKEYGNKSSDPALCKDLSSAVSIGDVMPYIRYRCGPPSREKRVGRRVKRVAGSSEVGQFKDQDVFEWYYYFPRDDEKVVLQFINGRLRSLYHREIEDDD
ncbi:DUF2845 domain-containing protein [Zooshikella harenae]|uniref:DUF2845 domain-containing protein n=1 Tax=Zooshikella harenae TaxID=2827238 RepID=A0ABS5ZH08_9GAMM|nr:DUF2845 domain-containing protein [Zooshikella harenae]MBU2713279.1 DUF2845 domain-containing protein [Zooshikella harenae]